MEKKLTVLSHIAHVLNREHITWAVGASMLLYCKGKTDQVHDIDIMCHEDNAQRAKELLLQMGTLAPPAARGQYRTRHFYEFTIEGVEVDMLAGFVIVKDGIEYDCSLLPEQIVEYAQVNGQRIPLQSLQQWRRYYDLMGRAAKVALIDG